MKYQGSKPLGRNGGWTFDLRFAVGGKSVLLTLGRRHYRFSRKSRVKSAGRNVGPPEIHQPVDGGASRFQMDLMGGNHHPRCHHYEWGPCTCAALQKGKLWKTN